MVTSYLFQSLKYIMLCVLAFRVALKGLMLFWFVCFYRWGGIFPLKLSMLFIFFLFKNGLHSFIYYVCMYVFECTSLVTCECKRNTLIRFCLSPLWVLEVKLKLWQAHRASESSHCPKFLTLYFWNLDSNYVKNFFSIHVYLVIYNKCPFAWLSLLLLGKLYAIHNLYILNKLSLLSSVLSSTHKFLVLLSRVYPRVLRMLFNIFYNTALWSNMCSFPNYHNTLLIGKGNTLN